MKVKFYKYPLLKVYTFETEKKQIVIAGSNSYKNAFATAREFKKTKSKSAPHYIIDRNGKIIQLFNTKYWTNFVGKMSTEKKIFGIEGKDNINKHVISIVLTNLGGFVEHNDSLITSNGKMFIGEYNTLEEPYRGYKVHEKYTEEQLKSLTELVAYLADKYQIPTYVDETMLFEVSKDALEGLPGIYTKASFLITDRSIFPQSELIYALRRVTKEIDKNESNT